MDTSVFGLLRLAKAGKTADIGEQGGDLRAFAAQLQFIGVELVDHRRGDHALEQAALRLPGAFFSVRSSSTMATPWVVCAGIFERGQVQAQADRATLRQNCNDFQAHHMLVGLADLSDLARQVRRDRQAG